MASKQPAGPKRGERIETTCPIYDKKIDATYRPNNVTGADEWRIGGFAPETQGGEYLTELCCALGLEPSESKGSIAAALRARTGQPARATKREPDKLPSQEWLDDCADALRSSGYRQTRQYLIDRGIESDTLDYWGVGYSLTRDFGPYPYTPSFVFPVRDRDGQLVGLKLRPWPGQPITRTGKTLKSLNLRGVPAALYPAPSEGRGPLIVCEGEIDALLLWQEGYSVVTPTCGTMWNPAWDAEQLAGRSVAFGYDVGPESLERARAQARRAMEEGGAHEAWAVDLSGVAGMKEKGSDVADFLDRYTPERLRRIIRLARHRELRIPWDRDDFIVASGERITASADRDKPRQRKGKDQATRLMDLARTHYDIFNEPSGRTYAMPKKPPREALPLAGRGGALKKELTARFIGIYGRPPSANATRAAIEGIDSLAACSDQEPVLVHLRAAEQDGNVIINVGDRAGRAILIEPGRWGVRAQPPEGVHFQRSRLTEALPTPKRGGSLDALRELLNVTDDAWSLVRAWLVMAWMPNVPVPILAIAGRQGSGKTATGRALVGLTDPSPAPVRASPRDMGDWHTMATACRVIGLDNISRIPEWLSDALCRAVTGEGSAKRQLYTDEELVVQTFRRAILLTYIDPGSLRGDLGERLLTVELRSLNGARRGEREMERDLAKRRPAILGGLCELMAEVLAHPVVVPEHEQLRMADAANVMATIDALLGTRTLSAYRRAQADVERVVLDGEPVAVAAVEFMASRSAWKGNATELNRELVSWCDDMRNWPPNAAQLSARLKRCAPALEDACGVSVEFRRGEERLIVLRRVRERAQVAAAPRSDVAPLRIRGERRAKR